MGALDTVVGRLFSFEFLRLLTADVSLHFRRHEPCLGTASVSSHHQSGSANIQKSETEEFNSRSHSNQLVYRL